MKKSGNGGAVLQKPPLATLSQMPVCTRPGVCSHVIHCYPMFSFYRQDMSNLFCLLLLANFSAVFPIFANLLICRSSNLRRKPPATPWRCWNASTTKRPVLFQRGRRCGRRRRRCGRRCWWSWRIGSVGIAGWRLEGHLSWRFTKPFMDIHYKYLPVISSS